MHAIADPHPALARPEDATCNKAKIPKQASPVHPTTRPPHFFTHVAISLFGRREPTSGHGDGSSAAVLHGADRLHRRHVGRT